MEHVNGTRRSLKPLLGIALAATLLFSGMTAAHAAPTIDGTQTGSLTVHKHQQTEAFPAGDAGDGLPQAIDTTENPALAGVGFTAQRITNIDLGTNDGWSALAELRDDFTPRDAANNWGMGSAATLDTPGTTVTTQANGEAFFDDLAVGAYLVSETLLPAGVTPTLPFIVTIPMTHPIELTDWVYDVHVYPKNSISGATKTVSEGDSRAVGEDITWTITSEIPVGTDPINGYRVEDTLDVKLGYVSTVVSLDGGATPVTVTEGTHYTLSAPNAGDSGTVIVEFTAAGSLILEANRDHAVNISITTTVEEMGEIENDADFFPHGGTAAVEVSTAVTKFGRYEITKTQQDGTTPLAGAQFSVFLTESDAKAGINPISVDGDTVFESDATGAVVIEGLRYSEFSENVTIDDTAAQYQLYWLAEVEAPAGYELLAQPISFEVDSQDGASGLMVTNVLKGGGFELPLTGGIGSAVFIALGVSLLVGAGALLALRARKVRA